MDCMSASVEGDSVPGSDCELHSVIEFQRIVLRQRHHNLISHAAKFALQLSSSTTSSHHHKPSPTHSNPTNLPSTLHSTPINKTQNYGTPTPHYIDTIQASDRRRQRSKKGNRQFPFMDRSCAMSSPDGFPKGSILMGMQCSMICP